MDGSAEPVPGTIIFYDWAGNVIDGQADHTAIVWKVENENVYTMEEDWATNASSRACLSGSTKFSGTECQDTAELLGISFPRCPFT